MPGKGDFDDGEAGSVRGVNPEVGERAEHPLRLPPQVRAKRVTATLVHVQPGKHGRERRDRRRA
jgi:hypothetical protein